MYIATDSYKVWMVYRTFIWPKVYPGYKETFLFCGYRPYWYNFGKNASISMRYWMLMNQNKHSVTNHGLNFIALLTSKHIFVLTIAEQFAKSISVFHGLFSKKIESGACAFTVDLYCCVSHFAIAITAGKLACLSLCLIRLATALWN